MRRRALIVFAKPPHAGKVKTRLGKSLGMNVAAELYDRFAHHAFSLAEEMQRGGVTVSLWFDPEASAAEMRQWVNRPFQFHPQQGTDLGGRMKTAFETAFAEGAHEAIIIGTDVPDLRLEILLNAFDLLAAVDIVLGPSTDGGYYLLGMRRPVLDLFDGVAWSTDAVLAQTLKRIQALQLTSALLPELSDIDTEADYRAFLRRNTP